MGLHLATCDKCGEKIQPQDQYALTKKGNIFCLQCGQAKPNIIVAWRTAEEAKEPEEEEAKEPEEEKKEEAD